MRNTDHRPLTTAPVLVLGIDTSLRSSGVGAVESAGGRLRALEWGTIHNPAAWPHSRCLAHIQESLRYLLARLKPDAVAIEGIFHCRNVKTAVVLGEARGAVIAACGVAGVPVFEYAPRRVKQALVGAGGAHKHQVGRMVQAQLGIQGGLQEDAADALALAICHLQSRTSIAALQAKPL
jgi:crossover junction endodeoxyribonuclease RuvC